jgi:hypothetical protein
MAGVWITDMPRLLTWLDANTATLKPVPLDAGLLAFIAERSDLGVFSPVDRLRTLPDAQSMRLAHFALLRDLQDRYHPAALPRLAGWLVQQLDADVESWHNRPRREEIRDTLDQLVSKGRLGVILHLVMGAQARQDDEAGVRQAGADVAAIDAELHAIQHSDGVREAHAAFYGTAITSGVGLAMVVAKTLGLIVP